MENKLKVLLTTVLLFVAALSCDERKYLPTPPTEPPKPPGYQEDIPWPSLADSPWPMYRADPQNTGRSTSLGIVQGEIYWQIDTLYIGTGITIGKDSTIYFATASVFNDTSDDFSGLVAMTPEGKIKWTYQFPVISKEWPCTPVISSDGTIYSSIPDSNQFFALNPDGTLKWKIYLGNQVIQTGINIDKDGNIYAIGLNNNGWILNSIHRSGLLSWQLESLDIAGDGFNSMSFSPDGEVLYIPGNGDGPTVNALEINTQELLWTYGNSRMLASAAPLIDSDGNIYVVSEGDDGNGYLVSLSPAGNERWKFLLNTWGIVESYMLPAIDQFGNIYIGGDELFSINQEGNLNWRIFIGVITSPIAVDMENNIHIVTGVGIEKKLIVYSKEGQILNSVSQIDIGNYGATYSLSVGFNGVYYIGYQTKIIDCLK